MFDTNIHHHHTVTRQEMYLLKRFLFLELCLNLLAENHARSFQSELVSVLHVENVP